MSPRTRFSASRAVLIGEPEKVDIVVADYDAIWPERFEIERAKIAVALGQRALAIEDIGSTSVPGSQQSQSSTSVSWCPTHRTKPHTLRISARLGTSCWCASQSGMSTECFALPNGMFTFMCSLTAQRR
jgi:GrpB protein